MYNNIINTKILNMKFSEFIFLSIVSAPAYFFVLFVFLWQKIIHNGVTIHREAHRK